MGSQRDYDVVVVGSGAGGLSAAVEAAEAGASVLLAESEGKVGGSSALSGGRVMAAATSVQRRRGIEDSPADLWHEYLLFNQYKVSPSLARRLAFDSGPTIEWLIGLGQEFSDELIYSSEERVPRGHSAVGRGAGIVDVLGSQVAKLSGSIDIALGNRVDRIVKEGGRVTGVAVGDDAVSAGAVVLTTGGFGANPGLWPDHLPSTAASGASAYYIGAPGARGDALAFAAQVGAGIVGHDRALLLPSPDFNPGDREVYFPSWLILVNREGRRVVDETTSYAILSTACRQWGPLFAVFDDAAKRAAVLRASYQNILVGDGEDKHPPVDASPNFNNDTLDAMVKSGKVKSGETIAELAYRIGVDQGGLAATINRYNTAVKEGEDAEFFRKPRGMRAITTAPYYATEIRLRVIGLTSKGPSIDADARVLDRGGEPIPGLFAGGECTGGVLGDVYMGSGNAYANCLVFGRIAGKSAARAALGSVG